jgi:hypothetical protein
VQIRIIRTQWVNDDHKDQNVAKHLSHLHVVVPAYSDPWSNNSRREMYLILLRSTVIMWPAGIYMNGELAPVQSGD